MPSLTLPSVPAAAVVADFKALDCVASGKTVRVDTSGLAACTCAEVGIAQRTTEHSNQAQPFTTGHVFSIRIWAKSSTAPCGYPKLSTLRIQIENSCRMSGIH